MRRWITVFCLGCLICFAALPASADEPVCHPEITGVQYGEKIDPVVTGRIATMYGEDQAVRQPPEMDLEAMIAGDLARREEALGYL